MFYKPLAFLFLIQYSEMEKTTTYFIIELYFTATNMHDKPHMISEGHALTNMGSGMEENNASSTGVFLFVFFNLFKFWRCIFILLCRVRDPAKDMSQTHPSSRCLHRKTTEK